MSLAAVGCTADHLRTRPPTSTVDFAHVISDTDQYAIGLGSSTFGASPVSNPVQAKFERELDARVIRVPVAVRDGRVTSGAAGAGPVNIVALVRTYIEWDYRVLVVINGRTHDFDVGPGDASKIVQALGYDNGVEYTTSNEPDADGKNVQDEIVQARMIVAEGKRLHPDFRIWGPVWASYDFPALASFAKALGPDLAGIDYHNYAMGATSVSTAQAMAQTSALEGEVRKTVGELMSIKRPPKVAVDELNFTWRYNDGVAGGDQRVFTAINTVWIASACGHIMLAGGRCLPYSTQNGPLGITIEGGTPNPDHRPASTPLPAYWGIAAWTGASVFPHMKDKFYSASSDDPAVEVYAVNNQAHGYNVVLINKSQTQPNTSTLGLNDLAAGTYAVYATNPAQPYDPPRPSLPRSYSQTVTLTLPPMSVATVVFSPHR